MINLIILILFAIGLKPDFLPEQALSEMVGGVIAEISLEGFILALAVWIKKDNK